ncbi:glycosyltransferase [Prosthecochloris sp. SCSIO W1101]|uniref:glycosyltransferase family 2 protein n=1 Tax=Prosthecochloris sp. SCSIO W1101 TaxID=2992242 RepID=UPI00223D4C6E|nr:glycosyltransferase [Prosthecochloris sp. SCSIO W1101]UZJ42231.1 glycosyltransferase [Prosthecochloris sp. SCSIO W1101]
MRRNEVSIITTVKNGEKYIEELLYSVYNQTYKNYEHIIVDDGSTDNTINVINRFCEKKINHHIRFIQNDDYGRGKALNNGVKKASGEWVAIVDVDDIWHPDKIKCQVEVLKKHDIKILCTGSVNFYDIKRIHFQPYVREAIDFVSLKSMLKMNMVCHSSVIIKKDLCIYDESRKSQYDYELWLRLLSKGYEIYCDKNVLTYHRIHGQQSYEAKMGSGYKYRSYLLKSKYAKSVSGYKVMIYNTIKLFYDLIVPRKVRIRISEKCGIKKVVLF